MIVAELEAEKVKESKEKHVLDRELAEITEEYKKLIHELGFEGEHEPTLEHLKQKLDEIRIIV